MKHIYNVGTGRGMVDFLLLNNIYTWFSFLISRVLVVIQSISAQKLELWYVFIDEQLQFNNSSFALLLEAYAINFLCHVTETLFFMVQFVFLTGGSVLLTLIINGSTAQLLLSLFGMDALSKSEVRFWCN